MTPDTVAALRAGGHSVLAHKYNNIAECPVCSPPACGEDHIIGTKPESCFACLSEQRDIYERALRSIEANSCCDSCREAALVAGKALRDGEAQDGASTQAPLPAKPDVETLRSQLVGAEQGKATAEALIAKQRRELNDADDKRVAAEASLTQLRTALDEVLAALKAIEWPYLKDGEITRRCACCGRSKADGHNAVCRVAAAITNAGGV